MKWKKHPSHSSGHYVQEEKTHPSFFSTSTMHRATDVCCTGTFCKKHMRCFTVWMTTGKRADVISRRATKIKYKDRRNDVENEGRRERHGMNMNTASFRWLSAMTHCWISGGLRGHCHSVIIYTLNMEASGGLAICPSRKAYEEICIVWTSLMWYILFLKKIVIDDHLQ